MKKMHIKITRIAGPGCAARWLLGIAVLASSLIAASATAQSAGGGSGSDGFYVGAGIAGVHGRAQATGSLDEREAENSAALRLAVGYSLPLAHGLSIAGEIYDLPTHVNLGLGDKADNVFGAALLPAYALDADLKVFLSLGFERAHTNSPVDDWRNFNRPGVCTLTPHFQRGRTAFCNLAVTVLDGSHDCIRSPAIGISCGGGCCLAALADAPAGVTVREMDRVRYRIDRPA